MTDLDNPRQPKLRILKLLQLDVALGDHQLILTPEARLRFDEQGGGGERKKGREGRRSRGRGEKEHVKVAGKQDRQVASRRKG